MADLTYRDMRADDFADLHALVSYWSVTRQLGSWPWPAQTDFTKSRCRPCKGAGFVWAICLHDRLIGTLGVTGGNLGYTHARARNAPTLLYEHRLTRATWDGLRTGSQ